MFRICLESFLPYIQWIRRSIADIIHPMSMLQLHSTRIKRISWYKSLKICIRGSQVYSNRLRLCRLRLSFQWARWNIMRTINFRIWNSDRRCFLRRIKTNGAIKNPFIRVKYSTFRERLSTRSKRGWIQIRNWLLKPKSTKMRYKFKIKRNMRSKIRSMISKFFWKKKICACSISKSYMKKKRGSVRKCRKLYRIYW